jgi:hypothetical protein
VQYASWHWIFFVNLPVGLLAGIAGWRVLAADEGIGLRAGADVLGALLATSGVMLGVFAIADHADWWAGLIALGLALLTSLAAWRTGSGVSAQALTSGYHLAFAAGAGLAAASVAVAAVALRPRASGAGQPPAAPVAGHVDLVGAADAAKGAPPVA